MVKYTFKKPVYKMRTGPHKIMYYHSKSICTSHQFCRNDMIKSTIMSKQSKSCVRKKTNLIKYYEAYN